MSCFNTLCPARPFEILKALAFCLTLGLAACGGGGDSAVEVAVNKQVVVPPAPATARSIYGDIDPTTNVVGTWTELIGLPDIYDFTYDGVALRTLIDGGPIGRYERGSLALLLTTDPSPTILLSVGHMEAAWLGTPLNTFKDDLREAVGVIRAAGKTAEIRGLHRVSGFDPPTMVRRDLFDKASRDLARELGVAFYDVGDVPAELEADGVHPTLAYSTRIGELLRGQMQP